MVTTLHVQLHAIPSKHEGTKTALVQMFVLLGSSPLPSFPLDLPSLLPPSLPPFFPLSLFSLSLPSSLPPFFPSLQVS